MSLNYSKWDNIVLSSDDDDDCHPNIDKYLWRRLRKEQRQKKAAEELELKKRLESENESDKKKVAELKGAEGDPKAIEAKISAIQAQIKKRDRELLAIKRRKKYTHEEMGQFKSDRTVVNSVRKVDTDYKNLPYDKYAERFDRKLSTYSKLTTESLSQAFLLKNPELLHEHCSGWLLLKALELEMGGDSAAMKKVAKQYLIVQYILDLSKMGGGKDPRAVLLPFFQKLDDQERMEGLNDEVANFAAKIKARAKAKLKEQAEKKTFVGEDGKEYEYVELSREERLGPGGLDPLEVLKTLPKAMREAFDNRDMPALQKAIAELPEDVARKHMEDCAKAGLWNPAGAEEAGDEKAPADAKQAQS